MEKLGERKYLIFLNACLVERIEKWRIEKLFCLENKGAIFLIIVLRTLHYHKCGVMGPNYTIESWVLVESISSSRMTEW